MTARSVPVLRPGVVVSETVVATAVPRWSTTGDGDGDVLLSVHVAPRLQPHRDATVADCPWLSRWSTVTWNFAVELSGVATLAPATVVAAPAPVDVGAAWSAVLPPSTPVRAIEPSDAVLGAKLRAALTFSSPAVFAATSSAYARQALTDVHQLGPQLLPTWWADAPPLDPAPLDPAAAIPLGLFDPPARPRSGTIQLPTPVAPDVHDLLAYLHDYPFLLRRLGLIVDLRVPAPLPAGWSAAPDAVLRLHLSADPPTGAAPLQVSTPWTAMPLRPAEHDGFLDPTSFRVVPIDTVQAASSCRIQDASTRNGPHTGRCSGRAVCPSSTVAPTGGRRGI